VGSGYPDADVGEGVGDMDTEDGVVGYGPGGERDDPRVSMLGEKRSKTRYRNVKVPSDLTAKSFKKYQQGIR
jgi:hypothetical protein